jgi:hypothetical protein
MPWGTINDPRIHRKPSDSREKAKSGDATFDDGAEVDEGDGDL